MSTPPPVWPPQPGVPSPYGQPQPSSNATLILILGIASIFILQIVLGPIAWILGSNALKAGYIDPAQASQVNTGRICGIVGTAVGVLIFVGYIVLTAVGINFLHHNAGTLPGH